MVQCRYLVFSSQDKWIQIQSLLPESWIMSQSLNFPICEHNMHLTSIVHWLTGCELGVAGWSLRTFCTPLAIPLLSNYLFIWHLWKLSLPPLHSVDFYSSLNSQLRCHLASEVLDLAKCSSCQSPPFTCTCLPQNVSLQLELSLSHRAEPCLTHLFTLVSYY